MEQSQPEIYTFPNTVLEILGIRLIELTSERVVAVMPIDTRHHQPLGYLHGGISVVLAETVASFGSAMNIDSTRQTAFGLEINANHLRPKRDGTLTAIATPIHLGRTTHVWDVRIIDEMEKLVCISRCTIAVAERKAESRPETQK